MDGCWKLGLALLCLRSAVSEPSWSMESVETAEDVPHFGPGIHYVPSREKPIFYTSYIPIIFQLERPHWDPLDLNWSEAENCSLSDSKKSGYACPIAFYLKQITRNFTAAADLTTSRHRRIPSDVTPPSEMSLFLAQDFSCEHISPHFNSNNNNDKSSINTLGIVQVQSYLAALSACPLGPERLVTLDAEPGTNNGMMMANAEAVLVDALQSFNKSYAQHIADPLNRKSFEINMYTALQAILLVATTVGMAEWDSAVQTCSSQRRLPANLINQTMLTGALRTAEGKAGRLGLELAIPWTTSEINKYYSLELTDCIYSGDHEDPDQADVLVVRLLVPVRRVGFSSLQLRQLHPVPSIFLTSRGDYSLCELSGIPLEVAFRAETEETLKVDCSASVIGRMEKLCHVSASHLRDDDDNPTRDRAFSCAHSALTNPVDRVMLFFCRSNIHCSSFDLAEAPYVREISPSTLFYSRVSPHHFRPTNISVKCNGTVLSDGSFQVSNGTESEFLLTVPCNCSVWENNTRIFSAAKICSSNADGIISRTPIRRLELPDEILIRSGLQDMLNMYEALRERMRELEASVAHERGSGKFTILMSVVILTLTSVFSAGIFQLWRMKGRLGAPEGLNYLPLDRMNLISVSGEDPA